MVDLWMSEVVLVVIGFSLRIRFLDPIVLVRVICNSVCCIWSKSGLVVQLIQDAILLSGPVLRFDLFDTPVNLSRTASFTGYKTSEGDYSNVVILPK